MAHSEFFWKNGQGLKIFGQEWLPEGEIRAAICLVHGLGEHSARYKHVAEAFNRAGMALFALDLPGFGRSEGKRGHASFDSFAGDIDALLERTKQKTTGKPVFLYGHSMGGAIVLYYSLLRKPELNGVIATSPAIAPGTPLPAPKLMLAKLMARIYPSFVMTNGLDLANLSRDETVAQIYRKDPLVHDQISARLGLDVLTKGRWIIEHAQEFPAPLLLVQGSKDTLVSTAMTEKFARAMRPEQLTYKIWEGFYHETHNEPEKEQVISFLMNWVEQHIHEEEIVSAV